MTDRLDSERDFWDRFAKYDPLWSILSDPSKSERRWNLDAFLETGRREVSLLMYQLRALDVGLRRDRALDFGCGVGRLSQPLAEHFDQVVGVDVSPEMIRLANAINAHPRRVRYVCNARDDLGVLGAGQFTFICSSVVLQHVDPPRAIRYLHEMLRVLAHDGVLVFQLPSHPRPAAEQSAVSTPMTPEAYRALVRIAADPPSEVLPGSAFVLMVSVTNASGHVWRQSDVGPIRLGNHWLSGSGQAMLVQDDGRAALPDGLEPGHTCTVSLEVTAPAIPGAYQLECDVVHEGISWFADKGSRAWRSPIVVAGAAVSAPASEPESLPGSRRALPLPEIGTVEPPGPLPMYGVPRDVVEREIQERDGNVFFVEADERCGKEWVGYRYFVTKSTGGRSQTAGIGRR